MGEHVVKLPSRVGIGNPNALLVECEARQIRARYKGGVRNGGESIETLARTFNVSSGAISGIIYKGNWGPMAGPCPDAGRSTEMGDGPDWRQVDRARLFQARAEERKKMTEEWIAWCESFLSIEAVKGYTASGWSLSDALADKVKELRARLAPAPPPLPETKTTPVPETKTTPLAESKARE